VKQTKTMVVASILLFGLGYAALWFFGTFSDLDFHQTIAAVIGLMLTTGVAVGLMSLVFHSARGGYDERAQDQLDPSERHRSSD
jgi:hypothetical protein